MYRSFLLFWSLFVPKFPSFHKFNGFFSSKVIVGVLLLVHDFFLFKSLQSKSRLNLVWIRSIIPYLLLSLYLFIYVDSFLSIKPAHYAIFRLRLYLLFSSSFSPSSCPSFSLSLSLSLSLSVYIYIYIYIYISASPNIPLYYIFFYFLSLLFSLFLSSILSLSLFTHILILIFSLPSFNLSVCLSLSLSA